MIRRNTDSVDSTEQELRMCLWRQAERVWVVDGDKLEREPPAPRNHLAQMLEPASIAPHSSDIAPGTRRIRPVLVNTGSKMSVNAGTDSADEAQVGKSTDGKCGLVRSRCELDGRTIGIRLSQTRPLYGGGLFFL